MPPHSHFHKKVMLVTMRELVEMAVREGVQWLRLIVELTGAMIVGLGVGIAAFRFLRALVSKQTANFTAIRLVLARYLALALEFQLGADILSTAVAPTWTQIGQLGAVAIIRTALNFFLSREMREERATGAAEQHVAARAAAPSAPSEVSQH
jgi:uncharacterized membrane protein